MITILDFRDMYFTPFRVENAQSNSSIPFISAPKRGILNEKWCKSNDIKMPAM